MFPGGAAGLPRTRPRDQESRTEGIHREPPPDTGLGVLRGLRGWVAVRSASKRDMRLQEELPQKAILELKAERWGRRS